MSLTTRIYRESSEVRLVLCPGELPDYGEVSRNCEGGKLTAHVFEAAYVSHLLLLSGLPEENSSPDALVKIALELERDHRQYDSLPENQSRAKARLEVQIRGLEKIQRDFINTKRRLFAALDRGDTRLFRRGSPDWTRVFSSFSWLGSQGGVWIKISWGTWYDLESQCFSPWEIWRLDGRDIARKTFSDERLPAEFRGQVIWRGGRTRARGAI